MKLPYIKPLTFPYWSKIDPKAAGRTRYGLFGDGVKTVFDGSSLYPHTNHIEMAGLSCSSIISYKINEKRELSLYKFAVFPSVRVVPNDTRGSLTYTFDDVSIRINGKKEQVSEAFFNGILQFTSRTDGVKLTRSLFPDTEEKALYEEIAFDCPQCCDLKFTGGYKNKKISSVFMNDGKSVILMTRAYLDGKFLGKRKSITLTKGTHTLHIVYSLQELLFSVIENAKSKRLDFIIQSNNRLNIFTPDENINREIQFTKLRASESIFKTKNGLMHGPGGGGYYAALWTNDQCEYANPMFAYLGYDIAQQQSMNCYRLYSALSSESKAIYTSIIAEGDDYWHGAGDRGDSSMYVYGFARYLLTTGDRGNAEKYLPALEKSCEYIMSKMNSNNVIESDSDELENRFESGKANLSTAVISYDAFISMHYIENELGNTDRAKEYLDFAEKIKAGISTYFEDNVEGYETYRYCAEEPRLRSWICLPLTVGINDRLDGTIKALQSPKLKKPCGLLTRSGGNTFWDRSLLYALRGLFYAGCADDALEYLEEYTNERLLGEHIPYPVEAFPEGNAAHLSAESALYVRIFTEGLAGFRPLGFSSFELKPCLPEKWNKIRIENFNYAGCKLSVIIKRASDKINISIAEINFSQDVNYNEKVVVNLNKS